MKSTKSEKESMARRFCEDVRKIADKYNLPFFLVTDGASVTNNNGCEAVSNARLCHIEWEKAKGYDYEEDWNKKNQQSN